MPCIIKILSAIVCERRFSNIFRFCDLKSACENCTYTFKGRIIENYAGWFGGER